MMVLELFWKAGHHPQQEYQSSPPEICVEKLQRDAQKYDLQRLYPRTLRSTIWRKLDYYLIINNFVVLAFGPKHNTIFLLTIAWWSSGNSLISSWRTGFPRWAGPDRIGSEGLSRRRSDTSSIIANELIRPDVVLIGQHYVNLSIGVKVMSNKANECVNYKEKGKQKNSYPYRMGRDVIAVRKRQSVRPRSRWVLIKQAGHEPVNLLLGHSYVKKESYQLNISLSLTNGEESGFTLSRFTTGIGQPQALECQLLPTAKRVNSLKMELFDALARLEPGLTEFGHVLD
jgi:hypothetical protein